MLFQGSVRVGCSTAFLKYIQPGGSAKGQHQQDLKTPPATQDGLLPCPNLPKLPSGDENNSVQTPANPHSMGAWQRNSNLTPEAWQQQVDKQQQDIEERGNQRGSRPHTQHTESVFKESKTMIIKNLLPTTTLEVIMKALDPFVYLEERNVRLVKGKTPGAKCFCFVDMSTHEEVVRLVDLLTIPRPITIDGVKVFAEIAKPLKNQNYRKDQEKSNPSLLGYPQDSKERCFPKASQIAIGVSAAMQGMCASADLTHAVGSGSVPFANFQSLGLRQDGKYPEAPATVFSGSETPELSGFLYDATSGFYYDPQTTLYYDPTSRYFYNAQTQKYLYWDSVSKTYVPVEGSGTDAPEPNTSAVIVAEAVPAEEVQAASEGATEQKENEEAAQRPEKKDKEEKPKSLAAFKIMKDMERWAKIQNRNKDTVRAPSPVLKQDKKVSKAADAAFAIFERKGAGGDDLFKKPFAPPKKEEKSSKRLIGSLGLLAADYAAGSDEEEEERPENIEAPLPILKGQAQTDEREDRLTDWKKMACLLCRRQFPSKESLIRHQQFSDLHKQNMEIHVKIKKSKKELEALENQEREMTNVETTNPPEAKRRKQQNELGGSSNSREGHKANERPGLGSEKPERKKDGSWNYSTYQQAVRKAMFARFKDLD